MDTFDDDVFVTSPEADRPGTAGAADAPWLDNDGPSRLFTAPSAMEGGSTWGSTVNDSRRSKTRNRGHHTSKLSKDGRCLSAPLLPAAASPQTSTWYTASTTSGGGSINGHSLWKPLGSSWRDWGSDEFGVPLRKNVDDGSAFVDGCIPHWGKNGNMRKINTLEHELGFAYYRTKRHMTHPHRKEVGDPRLPLSNVIVEMRNGRDKEFQFWRDLRPPFSVLEARKLPDAPGSGQHPDGDLHAVTFECAIDYHGERLWNTKSDAGTFDNRVHSTAMIRIPDGFPRKRPISISSWGSPALNWSPAHEVDDDGNPLRPVTIDPSKWMPISDEIKQRADLPRFAACRAATKRCDTRRNVEMKPLQKLLLGPHSDLSKLATRDPNWIGKSPRSRKAAALRLLDETDDPLKKVKPRRHCIFTAAAGFVQYAG